MKKISSSLSAKRRAASAHGLAARWGDARRGTTRQVRVSDAAYTALRNIPDRDRYRIASDAIVAAASAYLRQ